MNKEWEYREINKKEIKKIQDEFNLNYLLATILSNRGISEKNIKKFLEPTRSDFYNPFEMPDMEKAVNRIIKAIENKEKIIIYGDYDVDGITSITVLKSYFKDRGIEVGEYIPNRLNEGYGLNKKAIEQIAEEKYSLIITVDCGVTAIKEIEYANELKIDTIVTDHHEPENEIPNAVAIVDCKRKDNKYPFRELAGVGVAFKLCQALSIKLGLPEKEYLKYLDIVALGTVADVVPLVDENRVITKLGMKLLSVTKNYGLKALINLIGYSKIDSTSIGFGIAPRINACGRMGKANEALELLLETNYENAVKKAENIIKYNTERQEHEKKIYAEALEQLERENINELNSIVLGGKDWHHGVVGIVASKITDLYYKPCILVCFENNEIIGKGSGRSIKGFDLHEALMNCTNILEGFGGHSMAIGLSIKEENIDKLKEKLEELANEANIKNLKPTINIESDVNIDEISKDMVQSLSLLEPLGEGNQTPIFAFKNLKVELIRTLSNGKHIKLLLKSEHNTYIDAIGFNLGELKNDLSIGDVIDVAGSLEINSFNGNDKMQISLKDVKGKVK